MTTHEEVQEQLQREIEQLRREQQGHDHTAAKLDAELDKVRSQLDRARKLERKAELAQLEQKLHRQLMRHINAGVRLSERLNNYRNPTELLRRMSVVDRKTQEAERLKQAKEEAKQRKAEREAKPFQYKTHAAKATAREDGVPDVYLKENGTFITGFDAKLKSHLVSAAMGKQHPEALHRFTKPQALKLLEKRGWMKYLEGAQARAETAKAKKKGDR